MQNYIAILRGINVGGQNKLPMKDLKEKMGEWGFKNVSTYIQSGNIIFEATNSSTQSLGKKIEKGILKTFSYTVPVIVFTADYLKNIIVNNPFIKIKKTNTEKLHVTFLSDNPSKENLEKLLALTFPPDDYKLGDKAVYVYCPDGYGRSKINNNFFENKLKVNATTRNWKTVNKLYQISTGNS